MKTFLAFGIGLLAFCVMADEQPFDCDNAVNTREINACAALELDEADAMLDYYLAAALERSSHDSELVEAITLAQIDWTQYLESHCGSVYTMWREGTIRGVITLSCKTRMTRQRAHELWENFLTYADGSPPVLPEPPK